MLRVLGIIPARSGSKRLPGKNKKKLLGKPLISYIIEAALNAQSLHALVVNSDDDEVLSIAKQYESKGLILLKRPSYLATDTSKAIEYVKHTLSLLEAEFEKQFDVIVILQPTSPLTAPQDIDGVVQLLIETSADSVVSVVKADHALHPLKMKIMKGNNLLPYLEEENDRMAEHELPEIHVRNGSVYATTIKTIRLNKVIGSDCRGYVMPLERSVDINSALDFAFAEFLLTKNEKDMSNEYSKNYLINQGLNVIIDFEEKTRTQAAFVSVDGNNVVPISPNFDDLARIHKLIRQRKAFTVLEFGVGFSSLVIADALRKNKQDWNSLDIIPTVRNRFLFKCFSVDSTEEWLNHTKNLIPKELENYISFHFSKVNIGTFNGQICHFYENLPDIIPDFIYLDGPDPKTVEGSINGISFKCEERTVMSGDLLLMEPTFLPGTFILIDGRTNNARFLINNLKREYKKNWDRVGDVTTIELIEERLGKYNVLGVDYF